MADFVIELEENAKDSLIHGIVHYQDDLEFKTEQFPSRFHLKFSILSLFHSIELFLKARLVKAHPILIYEKPQKTGDDARTVNFDSLIARLKNIGVDITEIEIKHLNQLKTIRNRIEHHCVEASSSDVEDYIAKSINFLESFLSRELGINLKETLDEIDEEIYKSITHCLESFEARKVDAYSQVEGFEHRAEYTIFTCECCNENTVVMPNPQSTEGNAYCFLCDETFQIEYCNQCGEKIFYSPTDQETEEICDSCWEYVLNKD